MEKQVWLQNLTWEEVKQKTRQAKGTIILPVGSTEQHGYHLPVGTDTMVANSIAEDAAGKTNVLVAPPLWFGWSPHHMVLPGTITIRPELQIEVVFDIIQSRSISVPQSLPYLLPTTIQVCLEGLMKAGLVSCTDNNLWSLI